MRSQIVSLAWDSGYLYHSNSYLVCVCFIEQTVTYWWQQSGLHVCTEVWTSLQITSQCMTNWRPSGSSLWLHTKDSPRQTAPSSSLCLKTQNSLTMVNCHLNVFNCMLYSVFIYILCQCYIYLCISIDPMSVLQQDLNTIHPLLVSSADSEVDSQVQKLLLKIGVCQLSPREVISHHIMPILKSDKCKVSARVKQDLEY